MIKFIRSVLSGFCFFIFGIGGLVIGTILFPIVILCVKKSSRRFVLTNVVRKVWQLFVWIMCTVRLIKIKITNEDKQFLSNLSGNVVVANHPSLIDVVILVSLIPDAICVVKGVLAKNFWMGLIVRMVYLVNDENVERFLTNAELLLKSGFNIIIFPEGTRTKTDDFEHKLHRGFAQIALHSNANVLPIIIKCNPQILGKNQSWWDVGDKVVIFTLCVKDQISCNKTVDDGKFHEKAKFLTDLVRKILFF